jgi:uncharacterized protein YecA (UPF0149 family)
MKKSVKVAAVILGIGVVFAVGNLSGNASLDWKQNAMNLAHNELLDVRDEVVKNTVNNTATDINVTIQEGVSGTVDENASELERLMKEYYRMKLEGLTDTPEFRDLEDKINIIMMNVYGGFKTEVDNAFKEVGF